MLCLPAVEVTSFKERRNAKDCIEADIVLGGRLVGCRLPLVRPFNQHPFASPLPPLFPTPVPCLVPPTTTAEHERQKPIIIGRGGSALKQLGTASRVEVEEFLGRPVYLSLSVKVREGWRKDEVQLKRLGY